MATKKTDSPCVVNEKSEKTEQVDVQLSKNQQKKLKKREKWLAYKQDKRRNAKMKRKLRLAEMRENGEDIGPTRKSLKLKTMKNSLCKIRVVIDLSLDEYMAEKDINSLTCQLQHSYAANRRADNPMQLFFCGISGQTKERLDRIGDYRGWDIYPEKQSYEKVFPKEDLVYLSSESSNMLTTLSEEKVYVIGGLVDHNQHKGLCHRLAEEKGISHAQLPITDYLDMKTRKVLTVNQVFSILLRYTESKDWKKAFMAEMPQRKQANIKGQSSHENSVTPVVEENSSSSGPTLQEISTSVVKEDPASSKEQLNSGSGKALLQKCVPALEESKCVEGTVSRADSSKSESKKDDNVGRTQADTNVEANTEGEGCHKTSSVDRTLDNAINEENR